MQWIKYPENKPQLKLDEYSRNFIVFGTPTCGTCGCLKEVREAKYIRVYECFQFGEYDCGIEVTHYMEMPEPPNED